MKIAIIGNGGSGKTTLALTLHKKLNIPLHHLDQYQWKPGWQRTDRTELEIIHKELCDRDSWIIEGLAIRLFPYRFQKADLIIFLNIPIYICLWRVIKRAILHWGNVVVGVPEGCKQRLFSLQFLQFLGWVLNFNKQYKSHIMHMLQELESNVVYVSCEKEMQNVVEKLSGQRDLSHR